MDAKEALKAALASVLAPYLRSEGFKGSGRTFTLTGDHLDKAIVNVQGSSSSTADEQIIYMNLAVVPRPWAEFSIPTGGGNPDRPAEYDGLYRCRLEPLDGRAGRWAVEHPRDAVPVVESIVARLKEADGVLELRRLLDRSAMIEQVRQGDLGYIKRQFGYDLYLDWALAILLSDDHPNEELDEVMRRLETSEVDLAAKRHHSVIAWVRQRTASTRSTR